MIILVQLTSLCTALFGLAGCVQLEKFYPFGTAAGDQELARADDGVSEPLLLEKQFPYYDREERDLYVSNSVFPLFPSFLLSSTLARFFSRIMHSSLYSLDYWMRAHAAFNTSRLQTAIHTVHRSPLANCAREKLVRTSGNNGAIVDKATYKHCH